MIQRVEQEARGEHWCSWRYAKREVLDRHSCALFDDGRVWVVDPLDGEGLDDMLAELGRVVGVIVLLDRHLRDAEAIARRHAVDVWVPDGRWRSPGPPDGTRPYGATIPGAPFEFVTVRRSRLWQERALWWPAQRIAVVADALGSARYFLAGEEVLGVHPLLRLIPPRQLAQLRARVVMAGHGPAVTGRPSVLAMAVQSSRRRILRYALAAPAHLLRWARG